ncbi:hypothetical protein CARG_01595 [Corynebacterium argentoratense DSM 44202]|uniref:Uncharacterized protein n=1 Tax=Corynebacterium argentoratense DSM 44202 TaxID=1348662 RepID=U3GY92_9CORY|nr:hypothetical protein CARG_01595 [Corynebacterium argentoratense DSM 44202]
MGRGWLLVVVGGAVVVGVWGYIMWQVWQAPSGGINVR